MRRLLILLSMLIILAGAVIAKKGDVSVSYGYVELNITNEPPVITSLSLSPGTLYSDLDVSCEPTAVDRENDPINYHYQWFRNNQEIDFANRVLPNSYVKEGDTITCEAVAYEAFQNGTSARVSAIVNPIPPGVNAIKTGLSLVGVNKKSYEITAATQKGLVATTGFVVAEVGSSNTTQAGLLVFAVVFLIILNINLVLRIRKHRLANQ